MNEREVKDVAASVRQRLRNHALTAGRPFQEVLQYFAMERFLYRLSVSDVADKFVLKGALMFTAWGAPGGRPTRDIDLLGHMAYGVEEVIGAVRKICQQRVEPDGLLFDPTTVVGRVIKEDADYEGVRVTFLGKLQSARVPMQIDVGFGDIIFPSSVLTEYPTILDLPPPKIQGYSRESAIAEKFEAMVKLGIVNSRMKDFFDIWLLLQRFDFDGAALASAIEKTFGRRGTFITPRPLALTMTFAEDPLKASQWGGFLKKLRLSDGPSDLSVAVQSIAAFLGPIAAALAEGRTFSGSWRAPGPWAPT